MVLLDWMLRLVFVPENEWMVAWVIDLAFNFYGSVDARFGV